MYNYIQNLADNTLILGQRLAQWCGHGPFLEEDLALTNTSLDILGQAQMLLNLAAEIKDDGSSADDLAFLRDAIAFKNVILVEQPNGDFAQTMLRQYFMDVYHLHLYERLSGSSNQRLAEIAEKSLKEVTYHLERSQLWMQRLAHGTTESFDRLQKALNELWHYTHELFEESAELDNLVEQDIAADPIHLKIHWEADVKEWLASTALTIPKTGWRATGGLNGHHSEYLGLMLCEMQFLQRAYPNCEW